MHRALSLSRALSLLAGSFSTSLALALASACAWSAPARAEPAGELGPRVVPAEVESGSLLLRAADGYRRAPTLETDVEIEVHGMIARTRLTQRFRNPTPDWVEGIYVFPLPERAAVDSLRMQIGDRTIEGRVQERARARATYQKAKDEGRKASLVEQERPNIFTTSVAHLGPGEEVEVTLGFQEDVRYDAGRFSMRFPMVVAPRFVPGNRLVAGFSGTGWGQNTNEVPDAERITPPVVDPAATLASEAQDENPVAIHVRLDAGFPLAAVTSPSHAISVVAEADLIHAVRLRAGATPANADFVLEWTPSVGASPGAALFRETWRGDEYALVMVLPPDPNPASSATAQARPARVSRETLIVIDTSGSMDGESIVQARRAVLHALDTLGPQDTFNVIRFASSFSRLFADSRPATAEALGLARGWVERLEADGGTNMLPALDAALEPGERSRAVRQVIFVTDGAVGNERALFETIERKLGRSRLFTVGIGSAPNSHFMTKAAEVGRGTFTYVARPDEVAEKMGALFRKLESPVLHDLALEWEANAVEAWPRRIPDVYLGEPVVVAVRVEGELGRVALRGRRDGEDVRLELPLSGGAHHAGIARLWARRKIASLMDTLHRGADADRVRDEVAGLGVHHQLVTRWSSLVAVDVTPSAPANVEPDSRAVPSLLPKGWRSEHALVAQPLPASTIGRLPQGGTPAALLVTLGGLLLASATAITRPWHRRRGTHATQSRHADTHRT